MADENHKFVLGVDLDGVVADFYGGLRPIAAEWLGVAEDGLSRDISFELAEWNLAPMGGYEALHRFAVTQRQLFERLRPIEGSAPALRRLSARDDLRIRIITHRLFIKYFHQQALTQTVVWLDRHGIPYWDLCFMKDKGAVGADLYVEDAPKNIEALRGIGLDVIAFGNSTNQHIAAPRVTSWEQVETLVLQRLEQWSRTPESSRLVSTRPKRRGRSRRAA